MLSSNQSAFQDSPSPSLFSDGRPQYHHNRQQHIYQSYPYACYNSPSSVNNPLVLSHLSPLPCTMETYPQPNQSILSIASPSPPTCFLDNNVCSIRYDVSLEAPTAASQKLDEPPLTYLNKGQYYNITLKDKNHWDGEIISTVSITFHDESHRASATDYWKFWLTQQKEADDARAVELDLPRSSGAQAAEGRQFDRVSFKWNGKLGASVQIRFNCLSTDFSRIKGVKGIPLRLQIESEQASSYQERPEKTYCRIKLFRDKGAERKNKDDAKHIERQLEKLRGKSGEPHPLWLAFSPTSPITLFREIVPAKEDDHSLKLHSLYDDSSLMQSSSSSSPIIHQASGIGTHLPLPVPIKRSYSNLSNNNSNCPGDMKHLTSACVDHSGGPPIGLDPTYIPQRRRRVAKLSILVKFQTCEVYRAIYLEHLTVKELTEKISQRMDIKKPISQVFRKITPKNKKSMIVKVDDEVIQDMSEEQDIHIETEEDPNDSSKINLILNF